MSEKKTMRGEILKGILKAQRPIKQIKALKSGWSRWQMPIMEGYIMGCCDCGLEHEMQFKVVKVKGCKKNGWQSGDEIKNGRVLMRAKRI